MNKEDLEHNIKKNYKAVQNYLNGDPGAEGFLNSLADLQTDFADYLIEILKTKKYGKDNVKKSNIYQGHIKGGEEKYINNKRLEHIISQKLLGKKVSINSLLDKGIKKLEEVFNTQKSFEEALKSGKLQSIQLDKVILPSDDLPAPTIGAEKGSKEKKLSQNRLWLFISTLRNLGIYDDDLIIYSGKIENNMMRENTYYAIFIPKINKTVFLNTGYEEATFICEGEITIDKMTTLGKEKLQNKLGAIRIKFFENNIKGWENELKESLLGKGGKAKEKINKEQMKKIRNKINKSIELDKLRSFYEKNKNIYFIDSEGKEFTIKHLFSKLSYYKTNYKKINEQFLPEINFPGNPCNYYEITWNEFLKKIGIEIDERKIISLDKLKIFYSNHKNDKFTDSNGNISTIENLFLNFDFYLNNYKEFDKNMEIKIPGNPVNYYNMIWSELQKELGVDKDFREIIPFDNLKVFLSKHRNNLFVDHENRPSTFENLFSRGWIYYSKNYKIINENINFNIKLPSEPTTYYDKPRNNFVQELGIDKDSRKIMSLGELKSFYAKHKNDAFIDSNGRPSTIKRLFSTLKYYQKNYEIINERFSSKIKLSANPKLYYKIGWKKIKSSLGIL